MNYKFPFWKSKTVETVKIQRLPGVQGEKRIDEYAEYRSFLGKGNIIYDTVMIDTWHNA